MKELLKIAGLAMVVTIGMLLISYAIAKIFSNYKEMSQIMLCISLFGLIFTELYIDIKKRTNKK